jgi:hypothetical protein
MAGSAAVAREVTAAEADSATFFMDTGALATTALETTAQRNTREGETRRKRQLLLSLPLPRFVSLAVAVAQKTISISDRGIVHSPVFLAATLRATGSAMKGNTDGGER